MHNTPKEIYFELSYVTDYAIDCDLPSPLNTTRYLMHTGTVGNHRKAGCPYCPGSCEPGTPCPCEYHSPEHQRLLAEAAVR